MAGVRSQLSSTKYEKNRKRKNKLNKPVQRNYDTENLTVSFLYQSKIMTIQATSIDSVDQHVLITTLLFLCNISYLPNTLNYL